VRRALAALFAWRKVKSDWDARNARSLASAPIVRLTVDGTMVQVRLDRQNVDLAAGS
jgi:hypothetical protein